MGPRLRMGLLPGGNAFSALPALNYRPMPRECRLVRAISNDEKSDNDFLFAPAAPESQLK